LIWIAALRAHLSERRLGRLWQPWKGRNRIIGRLSQRSCWHVRCARGEILKGISKIQH
jgi:hypothetical protein